jgi:uncharacterized protein (TIGR02285 family)
MKLAHSILMLAWSLQVAAAPSISWYAPDYPPISIPNGELAGQGYVDHFLLRMLFPTLPQFSHEIIRASNGRFLDDSVRHSNVCAAAVTKTPERDRVMLFSNPIFIGLPVGLSIRREDKRLIQPYINGNGEIMLKEMLASDNFHLGLTSGRTYGPRIDAILAGVNPDHQVRIGNVSAASSLLHMLLGKHGIDAVASHSFEATYLAKIEPETSGKIIWFPIADEPDALPAYVTCSRSPLGREVIDATNRLIAPPSARHEIQVDYEKWLDEATRARIVAIRKRWWPDVPP